MPSLSFGWDDGHCHAHVAKHRVSWSEQTLPRRWLGVIFLTLRWPPDSILSKMLERILETILFCGRDTGGLLPHHCTSMSFLRTEDESEGGTSLVAQWLRLCAPTAGPTGLIPGQATRIPHAAQTKKKPQNKPKDAWEGLAFCLRKEVYGSMYPGRHTRRHLHSCCWVANRINWRLRSQEARGFAV